MANCSWIVLGLTKVNQLCLYHNPHQHCLPRPPISFPPIHATILSIAVFSTIVNLTSLTTLAYLCMHVFTPPPPNTHTHFHSLSQYLFFSSTHSADLFYLFFQSLNLKRASFNLIWLYECVMSATGEMCAIKSSMPCPLKKSKPIDVRGWKCMHINAHASHRHMCS